MTQASLAMEKWYDADSASPAVFPPDVAGTCGELGFSCNGKQMMGNFRKDTYASTVCLPAYPLAYWIAQSWWRILFEPALLSPDAAWSATHCMRSAGDGFLWPDIWFSSDGVNVQISAQSYTADPSESFSYMYCEPQQLPRKELEACLAEFIEATLARCHTDSNLGLTKLWQEVQRERQDARLTHLRTTEAVLGYDPDEYAEEQIRSLVDAVPLMSDRCLWELFAALRIQGHASPEQRLEELHRLSSPQGIAADFSAFSLENQIEMQSAPWDVGWKLAAALRAQAGITDVLNDQLLRDMAGIAESDFTSTAQGSATSLAIGRALADETNITYRLTPFKGRQQSIRFQAARYIGAYHLQRMFSPSSRPWLILSDGQTYLQKAQRAFGAELLLPIHLLKEEIRGNYSPESVRKAAEKFNVSPVLAASLLANHRLIPKDTIDLYAA